jgi:hypothetical protein
MSPVLTQQSTMHSAVACLAGRHRLIVLIPDLQLGEGQRLAAGAQRLRARHVRGEPLAQTHHRNR